MKGREGLRTMSPEPGRVVLMRKSYGYRGSKEPIQPPES